MRRDEWSTINIVIIIIINERHLIQTFRETSRSRDKMNANDVRQFDETYVCSAEEYTSVCRALSSISA